jgi:hypothetical protein
LKNGWRTWPSADFARYSISASSDGSTHNAPVRDLFGVGLGLTDQRSESGLQIPGGCAVEAMVDLAGIDQVLAFLPPDIDSVEFVFLQGEAGDRQRLALCAGLLDPVIAPA